MLQLPPAFMNVVMAGPAQRDHIGVIVHRLIRGSSHAASFNMVAIEVSVLTADFAVHLEFEDHITNI